MGMNDLWGKYYNSSLINNYWKRGIRSQLIYYGKKQIIFKIGFSSLFHTSKHKSRLYVWIIAKFTVSTRDIISRYCIL